MNEWNLPRALHKETGLKRNLDRTESCIQRKTFTVPKIFNVTSRMCIEQNTASNGKFWLFAVPL